MEQSHEQLSDACDTLIEESGILVQSFGVTEFKSAESRQLELESIQHLERQSVLLNNGLNLKLRRLLYLNSVASASEKLAQNLANAYEDAKRHASGSDAAKTLRLQAELMIDEALIKEFLGTITPTSRAIHHADKDLNLSELNILRNLEKLYSIDADSTGIPRGSIFSFMRALASNSKMHEERAIHADKVNQIIQGVLKTCLGTEQRALKRLQSQQSRFTNQKRVVMQESGLSSFEDRYRQLTQKWELISKTSTCLQMMTAALPVNWYDDEILRGIIKDCQDISEKLELYEQVISSNTLDTFSEEDLQLLEIE